MPDGVDVTLWTWLDTDDQWQTWPSLQVWVQDWWLAEHEIRAAFQAEEAGRTGVQWPDAPSHSVLTRMVGDRDPGAIGLIEALAQAAETDQDFADLGAGDIASLLVYGDDGAQFMDEVERAARRSTAFAHTLTWLWVGREVEPSVRTRLLALGAIDLAPDEHTSVDQPAGRRRSK